MAAWTQIIKSSDQTVTDSTTKVADTELKFAGDAETAYEVEASILFSGNNSSGDWEGSFSLPDVDTEKRAVGFASGISTADAIQYAVRQGGFLTSKWPSIDIDGGTDAAHTVRCMFVKFVIYNVTAGNITFVFSNNSAGTSRESTTKAGSTLRYRKIGS